jgi:probable addiction module antidote protein
VLLATRLISAVESSNIASISVPAIAFTIFAKEPKSSYYFVLVTRARRNAIFQLRLKLLANGDHKMKEKFTVFDAAEYIDDQEAANFLLADAIETGNIAYIMEALDDVARSAAMDEFTQKSGITGEKLRALLAAEKNPTIESALALMKSIGVQFESS